PKDDEFKSNLDDRIDCCNYGRIEIELINIREIKLIDEVELDDN
ncbi:27507_t:CDS:2, partial [Gigaspora margarita]